MRITTRLALSSLALAALCVAGLRNSLADCPPECHNAAVVTGSSQVTGTPTVCGTTMCNFVQTMTYTYACTEVASCTKCVAAPNVLLTETFGYACNTAPDPDVCVKTSLGTTTGPGTATENCPN